ncbi:IS3 family transposase [Anaerosporobacter sp.]|uniref:IS3 family transposase n=1 Tax=Anaerosporobacter sp. TaxID=1872529 RepID=UPI00286F6C48|nr:IS3 family transposase [Anaerosporobacter sp.]
MNHKYTESEKQTIIDRYSSGESVSKISTDAEIPRSTLYAWIKQYQEEQESGKKAITAQSYRLLENKIKRLEGIIEILQAVECTVNDPLEIKLCQLETLCGQYSVHMLCEALNVPRGTFYNHIIRNKRDHTWYAKRREEFRIKIQQVYDDSNQIFGAAKIAAIIKNEGCRISVEMVRELMQDMGLVSIRQEAKDMYDKEKRRHKNYLNQQFNTRKPNQVWVSDITYFRYNNKNYYICAILNLYARTIVGYKVGKANSTQLVKSTFKASFESRNPDEDLIFHTDR